jgi:hypothetical protein
MILYTVTCTHAQVLYCAVLSILLLQVDAKIKRHVLNVTAKEFTDMCSNIVKAELGHLR